jgi:hypothetical protein
MMSPQSLPIMSKTWSRLCNLCINLCINLYINLYINLCINLCINMCSNLCSNLFSSMCSNLFSSMCSNLFSSMCSNLFSSMCSSHRPSLQTKKELREHVEIAAARRAMVQGSARCVHLMIHKRVAPENVPLSDESGKNDLARDAEVTSAQDAEGGMDKCNNRNLE